MFQGAENLEAITEPLGGVAPAVGLEPTTKRLTAARSTTELRRNGWRASARGPHRVTARKDTARPLAQQPEDKRNDQGDRERHGTEPEPRVAKHDDRRVAPK